MAAIRLASVRDRLVALVLVAALPTVGLAVYGYLTQRQEAARAGREEALKVARGLARAHEQRLGETRRLLVTLSALPEIRPTDRPACAARFAALLREFPDLTNLGVAAADGAVVCSAVPVSRPENVTDRPWFDRAVRGQAFATGDHEVDPATGRAQLVAALPVPYPGGGTQLVVFAALDLAWVGRHAAPDLPRDWVIALSDDRGTILARYPDPARWVGQRLPEAIVSAALAERGDGTAEVAGADGVVRLFGFAPLPGLPGGRRAYLSVALPRAAAFADTDRAFRRNLAGMGLVAVLAILAAWIGTEWIVVRRVRALADATGRLATGDLEARAEVTGGDEIGALARGLNGMAARLSVLMTTEREARHTLAGRVDALVAERTHEVELLRQLSELLQACATPDEAHAVMGQLCGRLFPDAAGAVLVTPASRDGLWAVATWGPPLATGRERFQLDDCWALRRGRVYRVDVAGSSPACPHLGEPAPEAFVCVPLAAQGETLGLFTLAVPPGAAADGGLGEARVRLAVTVAEQFALALANVRLRETLRGQSIRDPLTGLFNRRYMEETLDRELSRAQRERRPLSLLLLDIDRFKHFNDTFGHEAGDTVLASLGAMLRAMSRVGDVACRYGGEEFVLILPEASLPDARRRAEEIQDAIRGLRVTHGGRPLEGVRCSMGVAAFPEHGDSGGALLRAADAALYRAKREGRDQVVLAD
ncbi:MAG TPA: diguanylate cyclase [Methylomirabilota bacterium]